MQFHSLRHFHGEDTSVTEVHDCRRNSSAVMAQICVIIKVTRRTAWRWGSDVKMGISHLKCLSDEHYQGTNLPNTSKGVMAFTIRAFVQKHDPPTASSQAQREDDKGKDLNAVHCLNPLRIRLAPKCNTTAVKNQQVVPSRKIGTETCAPEDV